MYEVPREGRVHTRRWRDGHLRWETARCLILGEVGRMIKVIVSDEEVEGVRPGRRAEVLGASVREVVHTYREENTETIGEYIKR